MALHHFSATNVENDVTTVTRFCVARLQVAAGVLLTVTFPISDALKSTTSSIVDRA
jgi:hypothetical protein